MRIELHCHTTASSDGLITPEGLWKATQRQGIDAVAITDHDTIAGAVEFQRWFQKKRWPLRFIVGEERTLASGCHVIGLFLREEIHSTIFEDAVREIKEQGGLVYVPHPCRKKDGLLGPKGVSEKELAMADGYEAHNAKGSFEDNLRIREWLVCHHKRGFGGSDAHYEADVGLCVNEVCEKGDLETTVRGMFCGVIDYRVLAKRQSPESGERKYAASYYAVKKYVALPRFMLPLAKQAYRSYWNLKMGSAKHELEVVLTSKTCHVEAGKP